MPTYEAIREFRELRRHSRKELTHIQVGARAKASDARAKALFKYKAEVEKANTSRDKTINAAMARHLNYCEKASRRLFPILWGKDDVQG